MSGHAPRPIKSQSEAVDPGISFFFFLNSTAKFEKHCPNPFTPLLFEMTFIHTGFFAIPSTCQAQFCYMILSFFWDTFPQKLHGWLPHSFKFLLQISISNAFLNCPM